MPDRADVVYQYDGSYAGLLCCVFHSVATKQLPVDICTPQQGQTSLFAVHKIPTEPEKARRVERSIPKKLGPRAAALVHACFLYGGEEKALTICAFLQLGYRVGPAVVDMLADDRVAALHQLARAAQNEAGQMIQFIRFADYRGSLVSVIDPKHYVLPLIRDHFTDRYHEEQFLIYDRSHQMGLVYQPHRSKIVSMQDLQLPDEEDEERTYQRLWKGFCAAVNIVPRQNLHCQMGHMPKRYWHNMVEMRQQSAPSKKIVLPSGDIAPWFPPVSAADLRLPKK